MTQPEMPAGAPTNYDPTVKDWAIADAAEYKNLDGIEKSADGDDAKASFASVGVGAWHNLGVVTTEQVTAEQLLVMANADYEVFLTPSFAKLTRPMLDKAGNPVTIPGTDEPMTETIEAEDPNKRHICRFHPTTAALQVLGTSSPKYVPISNRDHFINFANAILDVAEPTVSTCGVLYDGKQAFMSWRLPKGVLVDGQSGDGADLWLLAHTSHDLSAPLTCAIVPVRPVCRNTIRVGLKKMRSKWTVKHTANAKLSLEAARTALKISYEYADEWMDLMEQLAATPVSVDEFDTMIAAMWGPGEDASKIAETVWEPKREKLVHLFTEAPTAGGLNGWGALNAVGEWCDWNSKAPAAAKFQTDSGAGGADGYRFWRSMNDEKSVTQPKIDILFPLAEKAGYDTKQLVSAAARI